jgi:hypothetical protein
MLKLFISLFLIFNFISMNLNAEEKEQIIEGYSYKKPGLLEPLKTLPQNLGGVLSDSFSKESLGPWALIAASTTLLYIYDPQVTRETQKLGRRLSIPNSDQTKDMIKLFGVSLFRGPTDLGSTFYFFGDGWVTLLTSASFLVAGNINNDNRALQTSSQLFSGLLTTGIITQALKRITGRQSPVSSTSERGLWRPFPSWAKYQGHISAYDAFPSGHLATAVMGVTVLSENYQEYSYIKPIGYTLASLLAFQMVNNNVHWASDYPLGIAIGYLVGKNASKNGRQKIAPESNLKNESEKTSYELTPTFNPEGILGLGVTINY